MIQSLRPPVAPVRRLVGGLLAILGVVGCAYSPRWTPEQVAPPPSLDEVLSQASQALEVSRSHLPEDGATTLSLTRDGLILGVLSRNRSLEVQRFSPAVSRLEIDQARAAFDPQLLATLSQGRTASPGALPGDTAVGRSTQASARLSETLPTGTDVFLSGGLNRNKSLLSDPNYAGNWSAGVNQSLLRGAGTAVNLVALRQAKNLAARSEHELRGFVLDLVQQAENGYWDLALARESLAIRRFSVQLANEQLQLNRELIEVGKLAQDGMISAQAELASREADLVDAEAALRSRTTDLILLLNPDTAAQWAVRFDLQDAPLDAPIQYSPALSAHLADRYRPELAQSRLDLANRDLQVVVTRNGLLPQLDAFGSYGMMSMGDSPSQGVSKLDTAKFDNYQVGLNFQMAPLNRAERSNDLQSRFNQQQGEAALRNLSQQIESEVRKAVIEVDREWQRIPATRQTVKSRQEELQVEQSRFTVGKSTNLDVLQVHRNLVQAQLDEVTARVGYLKAITALYHAEGTLLDRRGIAAEIWKKAPTAAMPAADSGKSEN